MSAYNDLLFDPPAPVAYLTLRNPANNVIATNVPMLIDSGADVTLLPQAFVDQIGSSPLPGHQYELAGFNGAMSAAPVVQLDLIGFGRTFRGQFLLVDQGWGILGRNVLNAIPLLLDGPRLAWTVVIATGQ